MSKLAPLVPVVVSRRKKRKPSDPCHGSGQMVTVKHSRYSKKLVFSYMNCPVCKERWPVWWSDDALVHASELKDAPKQAEIPVHESRQMWRYQHNTKYLLPDHE